MSTYRPDNFRPASDQTLVGVWPVVAASVDGVRTNTLPWLNPAARRVCGLSVGEATLIECSNPAGILADVAPWVGGASFSTSQKNERAWIFERIA